MDSIIRSVQSSDAAAIAAIYDAIVTETHISFESTPPTALEMRKRVEAYTRQYPWLVCEKDGQVIGYAYGSQYRGRPGYLQGRRSGMLILRLPKVGPKTEDRLGCPRHRAMASFAQVGIDRRGLPQSAWRSGDASGYVCFEGRSSGRTVAADAATRV